MSPHPHLGWRPEGAQLRNTLLRRQWIDGRSSQSNARMMSPHLRLTLDTEQGLSGARGSPREGIPPILHGLRSHPAWSLGYFHPEAASPHLAGGASSQRAAKKHAHLPSAALHVLLPDPQLGHTCGQSAVLQCQCPHRPPPLGRAGGAEGMSFPRMTIWAGGSVGFEVNSQLPSLPFWAARSRLGYKTFSKLPLHQKGMILSRELNEPQNVPVLCGQDHATQFCSLLPQTLLPLLFRQSYSLTGGQQGGHSVWALNAFCCSILYPLSHPRPWQPRPRSRADSFHATGTKGAQQGRCDQQAWHPGPHCSLNTDSSPTGPLGTKNGAGLLLKTGAESGSCQ